MIYYKLWVFLCRRRVFKLGLKEEEWQATAVTVAAKRRRGR